MPAPQLRPAVSAAIDELCDRFEAALRRAERPPIDDWLPEAGSDADTLLPELVALELDHRIRTGESATTADYFSRYPELRADGPVAVRLVAVEFRARKNRRTDVSEADFRTRYPDLVNHPDWSDGPWVSPLAGETRSLANTPDETGELRPAKDDPAAFLSALLAPSEDPKSLGRLGDYHILRVLGAGGMGVVLVAEDPSLRRTVAMKLMRPEVAARPGAKERFLREARSAAAVEHPRVVLIHHVGEWNGTPFLVMPLMPGRSLAARLTADPPVPLAAAVRFVREASDGLTAAHAKALIHRDIKPDNLWLEDTAEGTHVRVLDFGLAHDDAEPMTRPGTLLGTPCYMAPEQAAGQRVTHRADLFSLGCVLYELLTRKKPFTGPTVMAVLSALANHRPAPPRELDPSVPAPLSDLTMRLLDKTPERRPASAAEVSAELRRIEQQLGGPAERVAAGRSRSSNRVWVRVAVCLLGVAGVVGWIMTRDRMPAAETTAPLPPPATHPLRVARIEVRHFESTPAGDKPKGVLGEKSFAPVLMDAVQVVAKLSKPGYAYLIAYRPDGVADLCYPADAITPPPLTDTPRYPAAGMSKVYRLREGTGLWVFAVIASEKPLPSYRDFLEQFGNTPVWKPATKVPYEVVWWDDGFTTVNHLTESGVVYTERGKDENLEGPAATIKQLTDALRTIGRADTASAVGFGVAARK